MNSNQSVNSNQQGAVALITAMIISILLVITTAGMVSVTTRSLRQSSDGAQSTKAYYAAEGGLEQALLRIRRGDGAFTDCPGADQANKDATVTCTKVSQQANELTGSVAKDDTVQLDLSAVDNVYGIRVEWDSQTTPNLAAIPDYKSASGFPKGDGSWPAGAPAVMEVGIVGFKSGKISVDDVKYNQSVFAPASNSGGPTAGYLSSNTFLANFVDYLKSDAAPRPFVVKCSGAGYHCAAAYINMNKQAASGQIYMLRLRPRYQGAKYRISAFDEKFQTIPIASQTYKIDVTAKAGNTFRRVVTSLPIGGTSAPLGGFDYVLYSDTNICKSFEVVSGTAKGISCQTPQ